MVTRRSAAPTLVAPSPRVSRAVLRMVEPGTEVDCAHCGQPVKFAARERLRQVIANVYVRGRWDRVEHFHDACYDAAGWPHGVPDATAPTRRRAG